ncbi:Glycoprotease family [Musa troglodytarum]|uniref:Glycoprotease family n=1 Tax=Musa troglodytarum TaxID=320322 RepID=A0A9E7KE29_9LILI|nr:Glycoprotease family [Musa troglodytarum]
MRIMCSERGGKLFATDDRYCVDNGAMIAYTGLLAFAHGMTTPLEESTFTQRFRTDEVQAIWREKIVFNQFGSVWGQLLLDIVAVPDCISINHPLLSPIMTVNLPTKLRIRFPNPPLSSSSSDGDQRRQVLEDSRRPAAVDSRRSTRATFAGRKDACVADAHLRLVHVELGVYTSKLMVFSPLLLMAAMLVLHQRGF